MAQKKTPLEIIEENKKPLLRISNKWSREFIREIAKVQNGYAFESTHFTKEDGIPLIRIRDIDRDNTDTKYNGKYNPDYIVRKNDILVGMDGDFKVARWKGNEALLNQRVCRICPDYKKVDEKFLFFTLQPYLDAIHEETSAVTVKHLSSRTVEEIPIPLPPLPIQQAIVEKLDALFSELDKGIEQLKTARQKLRNYRQAMLNAAFEGSLTHKQMKKGELPERWSITTIGALFEVFVGSTPSRSITSYWNGDIPWVSSGEVAFCKIRSTKESITEDGLINTPCKIHPPGTILLAMIGEGKTRGQAAILEIEATHNQNTAAIRINPEEFLPELIYHYFVFKYESNRRAGSGNNQKALNKERVKSIQIPFIPLTDQKVILSAIESRLRVADKLEETIAENLKQAEAIRQSILKKAFEGELVH